MKNSSFKEKSKKVYKALALFLYFNKNKYKDVKKTFQSE